MEISLIKITSNKNEKIKELIRFRNKNGRTQESSILIEGCREIERALNAGIIPDEVFFCNDFLEQGENHYLLQKIITNFPNAFIYDVSKPVFETIAYKNNPFGILVIADYKPKSFQNINLPENSACLICDNIEKPGNLGALLRTADGAGLHAVVQTGNLTDYRNPNVIRASTGAIFNLNFSVEDAVDLIKELKAKKIKIIAADPDGSAIYSDIDYKQGFALVVGAEDKGLSEIFKQNSDCLVKIPMLGAADSLNVYQAATVIIFEALRQRNFKNTN